MAYSDLGDFMKLLESKGLLKRIGAEVDPVLEIAEINDRVVKNNGPALLFENPTGSKFPVLVNAFGTFERIKLALEVDKWVNVQDLSEVAWRMGNNVDPKRDTVIVEGPLDVLEHASDIPAYGGKIGTDATKKWPSEGFTREWPDEIVMSEDIKKPVTDRWKEYGL